MGLADLLQGAAVRAADDFPRAGVKPMKRSLDFVLKAVNAAAFVICVEWFVRRGRRRSALPPPPP